jgi:hypothetical protein
MNTKLTLTMDKTVIEQAKEFAKDQGQSLSSLVENYFKLVSKNVAETSDDNKVAEDPTPFTTKLLGSLKAPKNYDYNYKRDIEEERVKRYLRKNG